jgi:hypothetical protein
MMFPVCFHNLRIVGRCWNVRHCRSGLWGVEANCLSGPSLHFEALATALHMGLSYVQGVCAAAGTPQVCVARVLCCCFTAACCAPDCAGLMCKARPCTGACTGVQGLHSPCIVQALQFSSSAGCAWRERFVARLHNRCHGYAMHMPQLPAVFGQVCVCACWNDVHWYAQHLML